MSLRPAAAVIAAAITAELLHRRLLTHGATAGEARRAMAGDDLVPDAHVCATRAVDVAATPEQVFPWLTQMGLGRAGWYSWDLVDNLGRPSARHLEPTWMVHAAGELVPAGPISFVAAVVDPPRAFVLDLGRDGPVGFSLAFGISPVGEHSSRLVCRARFAIRTPGGRLVSRWALSPGDGIMVHRQLRGIAERAASGGIVGPVATEGPMAAGSQA